MRRNIFAVFLIRIRSKHFYKHLFQRIRYLQILVIYICIVAVFAFFVFCKCLRILILIICGCDLRILSDQIAVYRKRNRLLRPESFRDQAVISKTSDIFQRIRKRTQLIRHISIFPARTNGRDGHISGVIVFGIFQLIKSGKLLKPGNVFFVKPVKQILFIINFICILLFPAVFCVNTADKSTKIERIRMFHGHFQSGFIGQFQVSKPPELSFRQGIHRLFPITDLFCKFLYFLRERIVWRKTRSFSPKHEKSGCRHCRK